MFLQTVKLFVFVHVMHNLSLNVSMLSLKQTNGVNKVKPVFTGAPADP